MKKQELTLGRLWREADFKPDEAQDSAIRHVDGPLFLAAGPGSGKTQVLLWRTLNLIVFHGISPDEVFLSTFTEKAARQLREGIRLLLARVTNATGQPFDLGRMYAGTAHSLCRRIIIDRRFSPYRARMHAPVLVDELAQYFFLSRGSRWEELCQVADLGEEALLAINGLFGDNGRESKHLAIVNVMALFNRLSEECLEPSAKHAGMDRVFRRLMHMYGQYLNLLRPSDDARRTDFALLQQDALAALHGNGQAGSVFKHVIIDEYQDTNTVQERLFFGLASGHGNICVVGDDDQALYRFRGATVENFVEFPDRCIEYLGVKPNEVRRITLATNYRSLPAIVDYYTDFIARCDWKREDNPRRQYRVHDKLIMPARKSSLPAVVASAPAGPEEVSREIAHLVRTIIDSGKVEDPSQVAFLYPSLKSKQVGRMIAALEKIGLQAYAPRAGKFLEVPEATDVLGVLLQILGKPERGEFRGHDYHEYHNWLDGAEARGKELVGEDKKLKGLVRIRQEDIRQAVEDMQALLKVISRADWDMKSPYRPVVMKRRLHEAAGLSEKAKRSIASARFARFVQAREAQGRPFSLKYVVTRATSIDWTVLELFYQICAFDHFRRMFDLAEQGKDEGPICNLSLLSQYLTRFQEEYVSFITAEVLGDGRLQRLFFSSFLYAIYRLGESEYEDAEDPFPRGRVPFLTIHQAKGLEFPVVVLGNPRKKTLDAQPVEKLVRPLLSRQGEPIDRVGTFDAMRLFYVALSRAQNLLVIPHFKGKGQSQFSPFKEMLNEDPVRIADLDVGKLPMARLAEGAAPRTYSFTADYLLYRRCARQYMIFRKYDFAPSTTQTQFFGSLVHQTLDDLHQHLIALRG